MVIWLHIAGPLEENMRSKTLVLAVLITSLVVAFVLAACATDTLQKSYFRRADGYTTASEAPGLMDGLNRGDLTPDQAVEAVKRWAAAKYLTSQKSEVGYEERPRLNIPYGHVGLLQVGPYQLVLPPRTYANLPQGDDELQDVEALCVPPGMIAWRFNYGAQMETREARAECYALPKAGWELVPSLRVEQGQTAYRMNEDGSFEFRGPTPGAYPSEIASRWVVTQAVQIAPSTFGIYIKPDGTPVALSTGIHYDVVPSFVNVYNADEMRYRTLAVDVYNANSTPDSPACSSELCGTIIDKIVVSGTQRLASFNVDVGFKALDPANNPDVLAKYANLGPMRSAIVDNIEGPVRESVRSVGVDMTQEQIASEAGKAEFERRVITRVQGILDRKNIPLQLTYVNLRSRNFDDADLRAAAAQAEVQLQRENDRIAAANARTKAVEAETAALEALKRQITLRVESISNVVEVKDGISCTELTLLDSLGLIDVDWSTTPKDMCVSGNTAITVTTP
jgi:hypothetical protein